MLIRDSYDPIAIYGLADDGDTVHSVQHHDQSCSHKCVVVDERLRELERMAYDFVMNFA